MSFYDQIHDAVATLVMFYSPEDALCQKMMPIIDDLKSKLNGSAQILTVNIDENQRTAVHEKITALPSFAIYRYGVCHWRATGLVSEEELKTRLEASADPDPVGELGHHHARRL